MSVSIGPGIRRGQKAHAKVLPVEYITTASSSHGRTKETFYLRVRTIKD